jgi:hypothetical protein
MASKLETRHTDCHALLSARRSRTQATVGNSIWQHISVIFRPLSANKVAALSWVLVVAAGVHSSFLYGQALPAGEKGMNMGVFVTGNIANTQLPYFADNALGFNFGAFVQPSRWFGLEVRGGAYPIRANFEQAPITAGVVVAQSQSREVQALPFFYLGGGFSKAQYSKADYQPSAALWTPCWQATGGTDLALRKFTWRVYELNWTETYTLRRNIRTVGISTGLVYYFKH